MSFNNNLSVDNKSEYTFIIPITPGKPLTATAILDALRVIMPGVNFSNVVFRNAAPLENRIEPLDIQSGASQAEPSAPETPPPLIAQARAQNVPAPAAATPPSGPNLPIRQQLIQNLEMIILGARQGTRDLTIQIRSSNLDSPIEAVSSPVAKRGGGSRDSSQVNASNNLAPDRLDRLDRGKEEAVSPKNPLSISLPQEESVRIDVSIMPEEMKEKSASSLQIPKSVPTTTKNPVPEGNEEIKLMGQLNTLSHTNDVSLFQREQQGFLVTDLEATIAEAEALSSEAPMSLLTPEAQKSSSLATPSSAPTSPSSSAFLPENPKIPFSSSPIASPAFPTTSSMSSQAAASLPAATPSSPSPNTHSFTSAPFPQAAQTVSIPQNAPPMSSPSPVPSPSPALGAATIQPAPAAVTPNPQINLFANTPATNPFVSFSNNKPIVTGSKKKKDAEEKEELEEEEDQEDDTTSSG